MDIYLFIYLLTVYVINYTVSSSERVVRIDRLFVYKKIRNDVESVVAYFEVLLQYQLAGRSGFESGRSMKSFSFLKSADRLWDPPSGVLPGVERPEREVNHTSPFSAEVKNEYSYTFRAGIAQSV